MIKTYLLVSYCWSILMVRLLATWEIEELNDLLWTFFWLTDTDNRLTSVILLFLVTDVNPLQLLSIIGDFLVVLVISQRTEGVVCCDNGHIVVDWGCSMSLFVIEEPRILVTGVTEFEVIEEKLRGTLSSELLAHVRLPTLLVDT